MLEVDIQKRSGAFQLSAAFTAPHGITVLYGRSGAGKTSLINAVAGLSTPDEGRIVMGETVLFDAEARVNVPTQKRRIGYIFQEGRLFPHLSVAQNLDYGTRFAPAGEAVMARDDVIDMLGIAPLLNRRPGALSGGEKQRVAIGRALLAAPHVLLADEPLTALDEARKAEILPCFEQLRDELAIPILYVSHSASEVARLATTIVVVEQGRVVRQGSAAEVLSDPAVSPLGAREMGAVISARVRAHHDDGLSELDAGGLALFLPRVPQAVGQAVRVRIAAHDVMLSAQKPEAISALNVLPGVVESVRAGDGPGMMVVLETDAGRVLARITRRSASAMGIVAGTRLYAIVKTVSIAQADVGGPNAG